MGSLEEVAGGLRLSGGMALGGRALRRKSHPGQDRASGVSSTAWLGRKPGLSYRKTTLNAFWFCTAKSLKLTLQA